MDITQNNNQGVLLTYNFYEHLVFVKAFNLFPNCSSTFKVRTMQEIQYMGNLAARGYLTFYQLTKS